MSDRPEHPKDPIPSELAQEDEAFVQVVEEFVGGLQTRVNKISEAIDAGDYATLRMLAHQLKGSAGGYGYPALTKKAAEIELHAIAKELEDVASDVNDLKELVSRVIVR